jgi:hypothetical protein
MSMTAALMPAIKACTAIGNESAETDGFVPIRKLLARFQTSLKVRPLLVEGMIASTSKHNDGLTTSAQWVVLVDSERYTISDGDLQAESSAKPLPARFRFTVAHELAHSMAFRPTEFGLELTGVSGKLDSRAAQVEAIEKETDRLAQLLLCPEQTLSHRLRGFSGPLKVEHLASMARELGVSRYVLLNSLSLSLSLDSSGLWERPHLRDLGIAIGERLENGGAVLRKWPLFINFSRGIVPRPFSLLRNQDRVPVNVAFGGDASHSLIKNGEIKVLTEAGTATSPTAEQMMIEISAERGSRIPGSKFLILLRDTRAHKAIEEFERIRSTSRRK